MLSELFADPTAVFLPSGFLVKTALHAWEVDQALRLRRAVFCIEQGLFAGDDRDASDEAAELLVAGSCVAGMMDQIVGTVRIHSSEPGLWWGSRLAVHPAFRSQGEIGSTLVRLAVGRALDQGCTQFLAHVQWQNVGLFQKLHWSLLSEVELHGRAHGLMEAQLAAYAPQRLGGGGIVTRTRKGP